MIDGEKIHFSFSFGDNKMKTDSIRFVKAIESTDSFVPQVCFKQAAVQCLMKMKICVMKFFLILSFRLVWFQVKVLKCMMPGCLVQLIVGLTEEPEVPGLIPSPATYFCGNRS